MSKSESQSDNPKQDGPKRFTKDLPVVSPLKSQTIKLTDSIIAYLTQRYKDKELANSYLIMPLKQVKADVRHGFRLTQTTLRKRELDGATLILGFVIEPIGDRIGHPKSENVLLAFPNFFQQDAMKDDSDEKEKTFKSSHV